MITLFTSAAPLLYNSQEVGQSDKLAFFTRGPIGCNANAEMYQSYVKMRWFYNGTETFKDGTLFSYTTQRRGCVYQAFGTEEYLIVVNVRSAQVEVVQAEALQNSAWTNMFDDQPYSTMTSIMLGGGYCGLF